MTSPTSAAGDPRPEPPRDVPPAEAGAPEPERSSAAVAVAVAERPAAPPAVDEPVRPDPDDDRTVVTRADWLRALRYSAIVFLVVRVWLFVLGLLSTGLLPSNDPVGVPGWPATQPAEGWHHLFTSWERFDALWFLRIASEGYRVDDSSAAFFPLYPLATRAVGTVLGGHWLLAAYLVSNVALVLGLTVLYRLTALELSESVARKTVLYLCVFPTGFFLFAPYTESLFLALSVGCLYATRRHAWLLAGYLGAMASLTRSTGVLLALPVAIEALVHALRPGAPGALGTWRARLTRFAPGALASAAVPLGLVAYLVYWQRFAGDWRLPLEVQGSTWLRERTFPLETISAGVREGTRYFGVFPGGYHTVDLLLVLVAIVAGWWMVVRLRPTWTAYFWASLLFPMTLTFGGRPFLSMPRFLLVMFPLFWALAALAERYRAHDAVVAVSAAGLGLLSLLFVNWYFIF